MAALAADVKPWNSEAFQRKQMLQQAVRNHGQVDLVESVDDQEKLAVKVMPLKWIKADHAQFLATYPKSAEKPWVDFAMISYLNTIDFPHACKLRGIFGDGTSVYVAYSLATEGDLFYWCRDLHPAERQQKMKPLAIQIAEAVGHLHELNIAHSDLSVENVLLTDNGQGLSIRICDFGMASLARFAAGVRGKPSYQAPEMHSREAYDLFLADTFAVGVIFFVLACNDYPWVSTSPAKPCKLFQFSQKFGLAEFTKKRKARRSDGQMLAEVISRDLFQVLEGLLQFDPARRFNLGESCYTNPERTSLWELGWMQDDSPGMVLT